MFNTEIKKSFINTIDDNNNQITSLFTKTMLLEQKSQKDLYDFNLQEIMGLQLTREELVIVNEYVYWSIMQAHKSNIVNPLIVIHDDLYPDDED